MLPKWKYSNRLNYINGIVLMEIPYVKGITLCKQKYITVVVLG